MKNKLNEYAKLIAKIFGAQRVYNNQSILDYLQGDMFKDGLRRGLYEEVNKVINSQSENDEGCFICENGCNTFRKDVPCWINNLDNKIMIIAQDPGEYAYEEHKKQGIKNGLATPFAADLFLMDRNEQYIWYKHLCSKERGLGLDIEDLYITDISKCYRGKLNNCIEHLKEELCIVKPRIIVVMGNYALKALEKIVRRKLKGGITSLHGVLKKCTFCCDCKLIKIPVLFMLHPSNNSNGSWKKVLPGKKNFKFEKEEELRRLGDIIRNAMK
jgi:uracil-DNA glycosylase